MEPLGDLEQIVLLAVLQVGDQAYGVPVQQEVRRRAQRDLTLGTIYKALSRLEAKGLVSSRVGEPTSERGGRAKRYYAVTAVGKRALRENLYALRRMAAGLDVGLDAP
jgi:PadR family transcriptional regulator, regulatory protein PadR